MKILHIGTDSPFLQFAATQFERIAPGMSVYAIEMRHGIPRFPIESTLVHHVTPDGVGVRRIIALARKANLVIVHAMGTLGAIAFLAAPRRAVKVWSGWGADYYGNNPTLFGPRTAAVRSELMQHDRSPASRLRTMTRESLKRRAAAVTDLFSAPIPDDLEIFSARYPGFRGEYLQLNYASLEQSFAMSHARELSSDVLVGNSASFSNNHLDVFELLDANVQGRRSVIVPLSYGESAAYADRVAKSGRTVLGSEFVAIREYMPPEEYFRVVAGCGVMIMGHRRQQALGNIGVALNSGARVLLDRANPLYAFLRRIGTHVEPIETLAAPGGSSMPLPAEVIAATREALLGFWGEARVRANTESFLVNYLS